MPTPTSRPSSRRPAAETRARILQVAVELFTEKGYEATSVRDISEALDLTKSSLYYHFRNKEDILASLMAERRDEAAELAAWVAAQPPAADLTRRAVLRWLDGTDGQNLQVLRLAQANQPVVRRLAAQGGDVPGVFDGILVALAGEGASTAALLRLRMAFDTVRTTLLASQGTAASDADILACARRAALALTEPSFLDAGE
ncbi:hypothetical protein GCM10010329_31270 [Streptomyces spiroverticillatus]|uniref:HTH tetR-type domain-containing protein n=1 Tax=Streptomyces finlayi TaxID=67296 RepID=A0A918WW38_9ACTN|nr:TetR/AcrR family transcriptional regulator [Streptomyces finlayi]GHA06441.1 hypothetical protein GCM10010329_31270 [Streptomyces spiroverticillatus]GHC90013.1 hypothetical protein GCM10010334_23680 [Streptomyces finlayi]